MERLDVYLTTSKQFENRSQATRAIKEGRVIVGGKVVKKSGEMVDEQCEIVIIAQEYNFVSRGGQKLQGAINDFNISVSGEVALDIGSSTGGFCDCLLQNGASEVIAVDIGTNQLHEKLKHDKRIKVYENTDIRDFALTSKEQPTFACGDLSFISLEKIIPSVANMQSIARVVLLIKPQFECGKEVASAHKGVIKDFAEHKKAITKVLECLQSNGFNIAGLAPSSIKGGSGNIEYVVYAVKKATETDVKELINNAIKSAKQKYKKGADNV